MIEIVAGKRGGRPTIWIETENFNGNVLADFNGASGAEYVGDVEWY